MEFEKKRDLPSQKRIEKDDEYTRELAYICVQILDFGMHKSWYDSSFAQKAYELLEKGYTLSEYQIKRILNAWDLISHTMAQEESSFKDIKHQMDQEKLNSIAFSAFSPDEDVNGNP